MSSQDKSASGEQAPASANQIALNINLNEENKAGEDEVTPWNVAAGSKSGIDYDKLISEFRDAILTTSSGLNMLDFRPFWVV